MKKVLILCVLMLAVFILSAQQGGEAGGAVSGWNGTEASFSSIEVKVYPNPVHNKRFTIELNNQTMQEIRISNIAGVQVYHKKFGAPLNRYQVILENIPDGIYLLKVSTSVTTAKTMKLLVSSR